MILTNQNSTSFTIKIRGISTEMCVVIDCFQSIRLSRYNKMINLQPSMLNGLNIRYLYQSLKKQKDLAVVSLMPYHSMRSLYFRLMQE